MFSEEKGPVVLNRGSKIIPDTTTRNDGDAYDISEGIYTVEEEDEYDIYLYFTASVKDMPLNLVIDGKTQPKSIWNTVHSSPDPDRKGAFTHTLLSKTLELKAGQRWWLTNKAKKTTYFDMVWFFRKYE